VQRIEARHKAASTKFTFTRRPRRNGDDATKAKAGQQANAARLVVGDNGEQLDGMATSTDNQIADLDGQTTIIGDTRSSMFVRRCTGCTVYVAPVNGSCFVSDCKGCVIYVACHQLRIQKCIDCEFYVWCRSIPVIEKSSSLRFGGYEAWTAAMTPQMESQATDAGINDLQWAKQAYTQVADFTWLKQQASPNWCTINPSAWRRNVDPNAA
jgi:hypothetical protein